MSDYRDTPVWINNYCNLERGFRSLVIWLINAGMKDIRVIDNHSTYEPLLKWYDKVGIPYFGLKVVFSQENLGHQAFWKLGLHHEQAGRFIVTDPDVVPDKYCPKDLVKEMHRVMDATGTKVGPGIRIDNLPDHYAKKDLMLRSECKYWDASRKTEHGYLSEIDTTFALYEKGWGVWDGKGHIRLDFPYVVEHRPWYSASAEPDAERDYYAAHVLPGISHS